MNVTCLKTILLSSFVLLSTSLVFAAGKKAEAVKTADLKGTQYCGNEMAMGDLEKINHLDERNEIDRIVISKKFRKMHLLSKGRIYKTYDVAFGFGFYEGNKVKQGDGRTPEGIYDVELKNENSSYYKALRVSYPNARDKAFAKANGVDAGGDIMIHGLPSSPDKKLQRYALTQTHPLINWTQGCIAVTDEEIEEIFSLVDVKTTIEICPR